MLRETRKSAFMFEGEASGDVEISRLESALTIDPGDLPGELARHPDLYYRAALMAARLESRMHVADMDARAAFNRQLGLLREQALDRPNPLTEEQLESRARQSADFDKAERHAAEVRRKFLLARTLAAAFASRGRVLDALSRSK